MSDTKGPRPYHTGRFKHGNDTQEAERETAREARRATFARRGVDALRGEWRLQGSSSAEAD